MSKDMFWNLHLRKNAFIGYKFGRVSFGQYRYWSACGGFSSFGWVIVDGCFEIMPRLFSLFSYSHAMFYLDILELCIEILLKLLKSVILTNALESLL